MKPFRSGRAPRLVLDPGVLISALISRKRGNPVQLIRLWLRGDYQLAASPHLLVELENVLRRPKFQKYVSDGEITAYLGMFFRRAVLVPDVATTEVFTPDPKDDYLVALARDVAADYLISGDKHLTELPRPRPPVLTPAECVKLLQSSGLGVQLPEEK